MAYFPNNTLLVKGKLNHSCLFLVRLNTSFTVIFLVPKSNFTQNSFMSHSDLNLSCQHLFNSTRNGKSAHFITSNLHNLIMSVGGYCFIRSWSRRPQLACLLAHATHRQPDSPRIGWYMHCYLQLALADTVTNLIQMPLSL